MSKSSSGLIVKAYKTIGDRSSCEDVIKVQAMRKKTDFVGLFDGHSGVEAACYAKDHLCKMMQEDEDIYNCDPVRVSNHRYSTRLVQRDRIRVCQDARKHVAC